MSASATSRRENGESLMVAEHMPVEQTMPTADKMQGPYDFAWLLERCADYGGEQPPWRSGGALPSDFRSELPPPPLQLLVPEVVLFEPPDSKGRTVPRALFFTDRAGFLRGTRQALKQGSQVCHGLFRLMRHRQLAVTLTHSAGIVFEHNVLSSGVKAWTDRTFVYTGIPKEMDGAVLFMGPYSSVPTGELLLTAPVHGNAYIWSEDKAESDGGLPSIGWEVVPGAMSVGNGRTMKIYKKLLTSGGSHVIPVHFMWLGGVAFQPHSKADLDEMSRSATEWRASTPTGAGVGGGAVGSAALPRVAPEPGEAGARRKQRPAVRRNNFTDSKLGGSCGSWRLVMYGGAPPLQLGNEVVASHFGLTPDGRAVPWPTNAKLLQACFWSDPRRQVCERPIVYHYDALRTEAASGHAAIPQNVVNHFERYGFLTGVADHNLVSSAPIQISQHLSFHSMLELVSGDFEFVRDPRGQLWIVDARNLYFIPASRSTGASSGGAADSKDMRSQKFPRYLSEEALHNLKVSAETGDKCQRMTELMAGHYRSVREMTRMDDLLRQTDQVVEITVPMMAGTDRRAFARTFGIKKAKTTDVEVNMGLRVASAQRRYPAMPTKGGFVGRGGRLIVVPPRMPSAPAAARERPPPSTRPSSQPTAATPRQGQPAWATPRRQTSSAGRGTRSTLSGSLFGDRTSRGRSRAGGADEDASGVGSSDDVGPGIEIVLPESAQRLLHFSGPGLRPDGPTLDIVGPPATRQPGVGIRESRLASQPQATAVEVPSGAMAAVAASLSASQRGGGAPAPPERS